MRRVAPSLRPGRTCVEAVPQTQGEVDAVKGLLISGLEE